MDANETPEQRAALEQLRTIFKGANENLCPRCKIIFTDYKAALGALADIEKRAKELRKSPPVGEGSRMVKLMAIEAVARELLYKPRRILRELGDLFETALGDWDDDDENTAAPTDAAPSTAPEVEPTTGDDDERQ